MDISRLENINLFLFDMDGTLWLGNRLYSFTKDLLRTIKDAGKRYLFITNNSSKSTSDYVKKLASFGIEATEEDFMTSAEATAFYLTKNLSEVNFYVCGTASLKAEFASRGIKMTDDADAAAEEITARQKEFSAALRDGISEEELAAFGELLQKLTENARKLTEE